MVLAIFQILIALLLIIVIMLQTPGTGLSPVFGGGGESFRSKRSAHRLLVTATVTLATILALISLIQLLLYRG